jgi:hypothetical protein
MIRRQIDAPLVRRGYLAGALVLVATIAAGPAALAQSPSASPAPSVSVSPAASPTPSAAPFSWPTLPPPSQVSVPARFEPKGRPDATTTRDGIRVDLWLSSPTVAPGEWVQAVARTTNLRDDPAWAWSGECRTSGTTVTVDLAPVISFGDEQTGNAAAFKAAAIRAGYITGQHFMARRYLPRPTAGASMPLADRAFVECPIAPGPRGLKSGASATESFAWYAASSYDGEVWFQPLPPGQVAVTVSWPFLSRGTPPKVSPRRGARMVEPITATTSLELTGDGPGTPSLPELIDIALAEPEFRAWVDDDPSRESWCSYCVSVHLSPGPTYERNMVLGALDDAPRSGILSLELDHPFTSRGIISMDPWTGDLLDVWILDPRPKPVETAVPGE